MQMQNVLVGAIASVFLFATTACQNRREVATSPTELPPPTPPAAIDSKNFVNKSSSLPSSQTLNLQVNHPNGSVLQVKGIDFAGDRITLKFTVTNSLKQSIKLNHSEMVLHDNLGNSYSLLPLPQNPELEILSGETIKGSLIFLGRIAPTATSLTLTTNSQAGSVQENATNPKLVVAIPISKTKEPIATKESK